MKSLTLTFVAFFLCTIVGGVDAQEVTPDTSPAATTKGRSTFTRLNGQQKTDNSKQAMPQSPPVPTCDGCFNSYPIEQPQARTKEGEGEKASLDRLYRGYLWATIIGVIGGVIGLGVLIWQAIINRRVANAAQANADTAKENVAFLVSKERARIRVDSVNIQMVDDDVRKKGPPRQADRIEFRLLCSGATDAFVLEDGTSVWVSNLPEADEEIVFFPFDLPKILVPRKEAIHRFEPIDPETDEMAEKSLATPDARTSFFLHFAVFVRYRDVFQTSSQWHMESRYTWKMTHHPAKDGGFFSWTEYAHRDDEKEVENPD